MSTFYVSVESRFYVCADTEQEAKLKLLTAIAAAGDNPDLPWNEHIEHRGSDVIAITQEDK